MELARKFNAMKGISCNIEKGKKNGLENWKWEEEFESNSRTWEWM